MLRSFSADDFAFEDLVTAKRGRMVSVCLPARDEAATVGAIVGTIRGHLDALVDEVVVADDGSDDATAELAQGAGARVVNAGGNGKGAAMHQLVREARGDFLVFCDADVRNFSPRFVIGLLGPLLAAGDVAFVKASYRRPLDGRPGEGGRVTELVARPVVELLFPDLRAFTQPLAGECAATRGVLESVRLADGYGVDLALLIDVATRVGVGSMAQVDLGERVHRNRPLRELVPQATEVLSVALARAGITADRRSA